MKPTPKTDEVIGILKQTVTVINLIEYSIKEIEKADNTGDKAKDVITAYQSNLDYCNSCKITAKDVYDEYWGICQSIESLPKCAKAMAVRFENVGIPIWICNSHSDYQKRVNNKIWSIEQQGNITKSQASDLMCLFDLLASWVRVWMFRVQAILKEMGIEPKPLSINSTKEKETTFDEIQLPEELNTDEAKELFNKAIKAGFMDNNYKFIGTWYQAAYFAEIAAEKLRLKYKWKYFQILWGYDKLSQTRRESKERFGKVDKQNDIEKIFR